MSLSPITASRGVSTVAGVALLVAIVVVLAAGVSVGALGLVGNEQPAPTGYFTGSVCQDTSGSDVFTVHYRAGEAIALDSTRIGYRNVRDIETGLTHDGSLVLGESSEPGSLQAGDVVIIATATPGGFERAAFDLSWENPGSSYRLSTWDLRRDHVGQGGSCSIPDRTAENVYTILLADCAGNEGDHDRGHGNDCDRSDEDNPGRGGNDPGPPEASSPSTSIQP